MPSYLKKNLTIEYSSNLRPSVSGPTTPHLAGARRADAAMQLLQRRAAFVPSRSDKRHDFGIGLLWGGKTPSDELSNKIMSEPSKIFGRQPTDQDGCCRSTSAKPVMLQQ